MTPISHAFTEQGPHERRIRSLFPDGFRRQGSEAIFPKPLYILAFTNRSGSNLLADYLRQTGRFRGFGEGLNGDEVEKSVRKNPVAGFPDYVARLAGPANEPGFWGIKASWDQIVLLHRANIPSMFREVRLIHSTREDLLGQAVSHWIAHQTNQWTSAHKESGVAPRFSADHIEQILMNIVRSNSYIDLVARALDIPRHVVVYERLEDDPAGEIRSLAERFSLDLSDWRPDRPRISRQRNEVNDSFQGDLLTSWRSLIRS